MDKKKRFCLELYYVLSTPLYSDDHLSPYQLCTLVKMGFLLLASHNQLHPWTKVISPQIYTTVFWKS